jgi:uncharacterized membrane protein YkvA (DUF1232 family)
MAGWLAALLVVVALYAAFVAALMLLGRREDAAAVARFVPDCAVLFRRLAGDPRVPRSRTWLLLAAVVYLASPLDLVPDVIPVAGQLDDAVVVVLVLRSVLRAAGPELLAEHWPGPDRSRAVLERAVARG